MIAETVTAITPEWLSAALSQSAEDVTVAEVTAQRIGTGQIGTTYRLTIDYADGSAGPQRLVAKLAAEDPAARASVVDGYRKEVGFYQHIAPTVSVRAPACWSADISEDGTIFTLLLEDLAPALPGVQAHGCTVEQAATATRNIAGLHAPRWNDPTLADFRFLNLAGAKHAAIIAGAQALATEKFIDHMGTRLDADVVAVLRDAAEAAAAWLTSDAGPFTVVHGDYRLDNLMFHPSGEVIAVDWQTLALGPGARDVAYLLGTSLEIGARRDSERSIVGQYHADLVARGVADYSADQCFDDYRLGQLQGPMITTLGSAYATQARTADIDEMFLAMAVRSCTAICDLRSLELVP